VLPPKRQVARSIRAGRTIQKESKSMKMTIPASKPRNPLAPAAAKRKAGAHRKTAGALRQQNKKDLSRQLNERFGLYRDTRKQPKALEDSADVAKSGRRTTLRT